MVGKPFLIALMAALSAQSVSAAADVESVVELTMEASFDTDKPDEPVAVVKPTLTENLAEKETEVDNQILETVSVEAVPDSTLFESNTLPPSEITGKPNANEAETECLNVCANAAFLAGLGGNICNPSDPKSFYNVAQQCSGCISKIWSIFDDKETVLRGLEQCNLPPPSGNADESKQIEKRAFEDGMDLDKRCLFWKTVTSRRCRPVNNQPRCNPGYLAKTVIYPAQTYYASRYYGWCVTYYPGTVFPRSTQVIPACTNRRTCTVRPTRPCVNIKPTCNPGYASKLVTVAAQVFPASTVTRYNTVTVHQYASYPAYVTTIPACSQRRTVTLCVTRPTPNQTCAPGYQSKTTDIPAQTITRSVWTGANDIVTVRTAAVFNGYRTVLQPCSTRKTVTVPATPPTFATTCANGYTSQFVNIPATTVSYSSWVGNDGVVTIRTAHNFPASSTKLPPCSTRKTVTIHPTPPAAPSSCAPGYSSKVVTIPETTVPYSSWNGNDNVATIRPVKTFPASSVTLGPCSTRKTTTICPTRPPATAASCKPGYESGVVTIPSTILTSTEYAGTDGTYTVQISKSFPVSAVFVPPCETRTTITLDPAKPTIASCFKGYESGTVTIDATTLKQSTVINQDGVFTVYRSTSFPEYTTVLPPCCHRLSTTITPTQPTIDTSCAKGYTAGPVTIPATTFTASTFTGSNSVVTIRISTTFPAFVTTLPACDVRKTTTVTPTSPSFTTTCTPGYTSGIISVPPLTISSSTVTGKDEIVTVHEAEVFPGFNTVLPGCSTRKTITHVPERPPFVSKCTPGYESGVVTIPAVTFTASVVTGTDETVTVHKATVYPPGTTNLPACETRVTTTLEPSKPSITETCASGYASSTVTIPGTTFTASTKTGSNNIVTVYKAATYPASSTVLEACTKRRTVTLPQTIEVTETCKPGYTSGEVIIPGTSFTASITTGKDDIVSTWPATSVPAITTSLPACSTRETVYSDYPKPTPKVSCAEGYVSGPVTIPATTFTASTVTGKNQIVTIHKSTSFPVSVVTLPPCSIRQTLTIVPTQPTITNTCAPGYTSGPVEIPATTFTASTFTGKDEVVTVQEAKTFPASKTTLPPCDKRTTTTVVPPRPSITETCAPGYVSGPVVISGKEFEAKTSTGSDETVTVHKYTSYPPTTVTLKPCSTRKSTTIVPTKPAFQTSCIPGYNSGVVTVPATSFPGSTIVGSDEVVTIHQSATFTAYTTSLPPCDKRTTTTITRTQPKPETSCAKGYTPGLVTISATTFPATTTTGANEIVTITLSASFPIFSTSLPACDTRSTTTFVPTKPPNKATCAPGYTSGTLTFAAVTFSSSTVTGEDEVVTVHSGIVYPAVTTVLKPCDTRKTTTITRTKPLVTASCVPGYVSGDYTVTGVTLEASTVTGLDETVTIHEATSFPLYTTKLPPCDKRSTTSVVQTKPKITASCTPGYVSGPISVPAVTIPATTETGKDEVITIHLSTSFPAYVTTLPPCDKRQTTTVTQAKPTLDTTCAPGYVSGPVTVSATTIAASTVTGKDEIVTVHEAATFTGYTTTLPPCDKRQTTTVTQAKPTLDTTCAPGYVSGPVTVPATTITASTVTGKDEIVTVHEAATFTGYTTTLPPCDKRSTVTVPPTVPPQPTTQTCVEGTNSGKLTFPGTSITDSTVTGTDNVVTVYPGTSFEPSTTMLPGCTTSTSTSTESSTSETETPTSIIGEPHSSSSTEGPEPTDSGVPSGSSSVPAESSDVPSGSSEGPEPTDSGVPSGSSEGPEPTDSGVPSDSSEGPEPTDSGVPSGSSEGPEPTGSGVPSGSSEGPEPTDSGVPSGSSEGPEPTDSGVPSGSSEGPEPTDSGVPSGSSEGPEPTDSGVPSGSSEGPEPTNSGVPGESSGVPSGSSGVPSGSSEGPEPTDSGVPSGSSSAPAESSDVPSGSSEGPEPTNSGVPSGSSEGPEPTDSGVPSGSSEGPEPTNSGVPSGSSEGPEPTDSGVPSGSSSVPAESSGVPSGSSSAPAESSDVPSGSSEGPEPTNSGVPSGSSSVPAESSGVPSGSSEGPEPTDSGVPSGSSSVPAESSGVPSGSSEGPEPTNSGVPSGSSEGPEPTDSGVPSGSSSVPAESSGVPSGSSEGPEPTDSGVPSGSSSVPAESSGVPSGSSEGPEPTNSGVPSGSSEGPEPTDSGVPSGSSSVPAESSGVPSSSSEGPEPTDSGVPSGSSSAPAESSGVPSGSSEGPEPTNSGVPSGSSSVPAESSGVPSGSSEGPEPTNSGVPSGSSEGPEPTDSGVPSGSSSVPAESSGVPSSSSSVSEEPSSSSSSSAPATTSSTTPVSVPPTKTSSCTKCTCTPQPPVCVKYDIYKAFYCGEWIMYKVCSNFAFIGCGYDNIEKREVSGNAPVAVTTTLTDLPDEEATALADVTKIEKAVTSVMDSLKTNVGEGIKIMDPSEIDFAKIEQPVIVSKIEKPALVKPSAEGGIVKRDESATTTVPKVTGTKNITTTSAPAVQATSGAIRIEVFTFFYAFIALTAGLIMV